MAGLTALGLIAMLLQPAVLILLPQPDKKAPENILFSGAFCIE
jgi:hypothetical protein